MSKVGWVARVRRERWTYGVAIRESGEYVGHWVVRRLGQTRDWETVVVY